jgi:hypothetical protein
MSRAARPPGWHWWRLIVCRSAQRHAAHLRQPLPKWCLSIAFDNQVGSMARKSVFVVISMLLLLGSAPARGQTRLFAEASALFDHDPTAFVPAGTEAAIGVSIGITLKDRYSFRLNVETPRLHELTMSSSLRVLDRIASRTSTESRRTIAYSVLAGRQFQVSRLVNAAVFYGGSLTDRSSRRVGSDDDSTLDGAVVQHRPFDLRFDDRALAITWGIEAALKVTTHLYVVPSLRFHYYPPVFLDEDPWPLITRGGVGARWRF